MEIVIHDHTTWLTWPIDNQAFNSQARTSIASIRPRGAWIMQCGMNCSGVFRAIHPTERPTALGMSITLNVEVRWRNAFVNITGASGNRHISISMRPPEGTANWDRSYRGPITVVRMCDVAEPVVNRTTDGAEQSPTVQEVVESPDVASSSSVRPTGDDSHASVREVQIIEEVHIGQLRSIIPPNVMPFSNHTESSNVARPTYPLSSCLAWIRLFYPSSRLEWC